MTGQNKITGLRRRDKMQQITGTFKAIGIGATAVPTQVGTTGAFSYESNSYTSTQAGGTKAYGFSFNSANSPDARTSPKTEMESGTLLVYMYTGGYAA